MIIIGPMEREFSRRCRHLLAACTSMLWWLLFAVGLAAQPVGPSGPEPVGGVNHEQVQAPDYCVDSCCHADILLLNSGYDHAAGNIYAVGATDDYWTIVADQDPTRPVPRRANVISPHPVWSGPLFNTQWIGANAGPDDQFVGQVTYEKCFCVCRETELAFSLEILADDSASVYLDGVYQGCTINPALNTPSSVNFSVVVGPGRHCLDVVVDNLFVTAAGVDIRGSIEGPGLVKYTCCGPTPIDTCAIQRLTLGTGPGWEITGGPENGGPYPRCADIIDPPLEGWGSPIDGTMWIGPNPAGEVHDGEQKYSYRKCFCVAEEGTFSIFMSMMADDRATVTLDGVSVFSVPSPGSHAPTDGRVSIKLQPGCHCFDIVVTSCCGRTGLDALIDISGGLQGGTLLRPECCECDRCHEIEGRAGRHPDLGEARRMDLSR
jgi:hypothetical protein